MNKTEKEILTQIDSTYEKMEKSIIPLEKHRLKMKIEALQKQYDELNANEIVDAKKNQR